MTGEPGALHVTELGEIPPDEAQILRYALMPSTAQAPGELPLKECLAAVRGAVRCRAVWRRFVVQREGEELNLGFARTGSRSLARRLEGCGEILLFACTAGGEMERQIARAKVLSPARGLLMHAIGAQQVEGACDLLCRQLAEAFPGWKLTERYSPGYGDLDLTIQREVFAALDCERTIGVTLTESLLMKPSKSVTAIIGMKERKKDEPEESIA